MPAMPKISAAWLVPLLLAAVAAGTPAQTVYRIVGPDGRVTFSDRPPTEPQAQAQPAKVGGAGPDDDGNAALPYALREVAVRYPVTLYSSSNCAPCDSARQLLQARGIPFTEYTVGSAEDIEALQKLSGQNSLPFATIGRQHLLGYAEAEWTQYLDAAGYPKTSQLPPNYHRPPPKPLVARTAAEPAAPAAAAASAASAPSARPSAAPQRPTKNSDNPAGIRF